MIYYIEDDAGQIHGPYPSDRTAQEARKSIGGRVLSCENHVWQEICKHNKIQKPEGSGLMAKPLKGKPQRVSVGDRVKIGRNVMSCWKKYTGQIGTVSHADPGAMTVGVKMPDGIEIWAWDRVITKYNEPFPEELREKITDPDAPEVHQIFREVQEMHGVESGDVDPPWWTSLSERIERGITPDALREIVKDYYFETAEEEPRRSDMAPIMSYKVWLRRHGDNDDEFSRQLYSDYAGEKTEIGWRGEVEPEFIAGALHINVKRVADKWYVDVWDTQFNERAEDLERSFKTKTEAIDYAKILYRPEEAPMESSDAFRTIKELERKIKDYRLGNLKKYNYENFIDHLIDYKEWLEGN